MEVERSMARKRTLSRQRSKLPPTQISKAVYGRENVVKISFTTDATSTDLSGRWKTVYGMVQTMQSSNDWVNYAASYQLFNVTKVKLQILPGYSIGASSTAPSLNAMGVCYSSKDNGALTNINQIADHTNYTVFGTGNMDTSIKHFFKCKLRPKIRPPQSTADTAENFGWIKAYSDQLTGTSAGVFVAKLIFTFTVVFSAES